ncbi:MAG: hypothetical protein JWO05_2651 [Gemmatimonadetes bacterium]|nr:hypothetical protein [Gemmatimonadota bacterium]
MDGPDPRATFAAGQAQLAELERYITEADARGDDVPATARLMLAHLRELMVALTALTSSLGHPGEVPPSVPPAVPPADTP